MKKKEYQSTFLSSGVAISSVLFLSLAFIIFPAVFTANAAPTSRGDAPGGGDGSPCNSNIECGGGQCTASFCFGPGADVVEGGGTLNPDDETTNTANYTTTYISSSNSGRAICNIEAHVNNVTGHVFFSGTVVNRVPLTYATPDFYPTTEIRLYDNRNPGRSVVSVQTTTAADLYDAGSFANGTYTAANTGATVDGTAYGPVDPQTQTPASASCTSVTDNFTVNVPAAQLDLTTYAIIPNPASADPSTGFWSVAVGTQEKFTGWVKNIGGASSPATFPYFFQVSTTASDAGLLPDLAPGTMTILAPFQYAQASSPYYTFSSSGTYYVRLCANKSNRSSTISGESSTSNNCGDWTPVIATNSSSSAPTATATPGLCGDKRLQIAWTPATGATAYHIYRINGGVTGTTDLCTLFNCTTLSFFDDGDSHAGLTPGALYTYGITASN